MKKSAGRKERRAMARRNRIEENKQNNYILNQPGFSKAKKAIRKRLGIA